MVATDKRPGSVPNRRRSKWAPRDLQKKIALVAFSVGAIVLMFNLQFGFIGLWMIYQSPADTLEGVLQQTKNLMVTQFVVVGLITTLFALWAGLTFFPVAGPIHRFKLFFTEMSSGRWDVACNLRDKDHLQDVKDEINSALGLMVENIKAKHEILSDAREILEKDSTSSTNPKVQDLLARIEEAAVEHSRRFGETEAAKQTEAAAVS